MPEARLDDRGRLTIPKEYRERFGDRYRIVTRNDGIKLIPVDEDPLGALREEFTDVDKSAAELREEARQDAVDDAGS